MKQLLLSILAGIWAASLCAQVNFTESHLPVLVINTNGQTIPDEPKITAQAGLIYNGPGQTNHLSDPFNAYNGPVGIERRGASSYNYEKRPYGIEWRDANGEDIDVALLGLPAESDFALISPLNDKTLIRDVLAHQLAQDALPWSPRTRLIETVLNGEYIGVYTLIETIKRGSNRVDIAKLKDSDVSGPQLSGGYILRMDKYGPPPGALGGDWKSEYPAMQGSWQETWFQHHYPKSDDILPVQQQYIRQWIGDFEDMMASPSYQNTLEQWIDMDSWVNYLLVQELVKNTDAYRLSAYFYKDRDDAPGGGKIAMGPVWDCNIAFGIGDYCGGNEWTGWAKDFNQVCGFDQWIIHFWWEKVWAYPAFRQRMAERWETLRAGPWSDAQLMQRIDSLVAVVGAAQVRNFQRWPVLGTYVWPNAYIGNTYQQEINYLKNWLLNRTAWLDQQIFLASLSVDSSLSHAPFAIFPNPTSEVLYVKRNGVPPLGGACNFILYAPDGKLVHLQKALCGDEIFKLNLPDLKGPHAYKFTDYKGEILDSGWLVLE